MVINQASIKRDGVQDFVSLRATALILLAYIIFMLGFFVATPELTYEIWRHLFSSLAMKIFSSLTLLSLAVHARIGLWQVLSDYIKPKPLRAFLYYLVNIITLAYFIGGIFVLWSVK